MVRNILIILLSSVLLFSCAPSSSPERHVNIISIGFSYEGNSAGLNPLVTGPHDDAGYMARHLGYLASEAGYEVTTLLVSDRDGSMIDEGTGMRLSWEDLTGQFHQLSAGPSDLNIFYFSGHGLYYEDDSYICFPDGGIWDLPDIAGMLEYIGGRSVMIIDACLSVSLSGNDVGTGEVYEYDDEIQAEHLVGISPAVAIRDAFRSSFSARTYGGVYVLSACTTGQLSYAGTLEDPNSLFTSMMLEYLGFDSGTLTSHIPSDEITFSSLYKGIMGITRNRYGIFAEGREPDAVGDVQTPQPSRVPTDLVLFRF